LGAALLWLQENCDNKEKQGLRLLSAIFKHRGLKRFRKRPGIAASSSTQEMATKTMERGGLKALSKDEI